MNKLSKFEGLWLFASLFSVVTLCYIYHLWKFTGDEMFREWGYNFCIFFFGFTAICVLLNLVMRGIILKNI